MTHHRLLRAVAGLLGAGATFMACAQNPSRADDTWLLCTPGPLESLFMPLEDSGIAREQAPTDVFARSFNVKDQNDYHAEGEVELRRADQQLRSDRLDVKNQPRRFEADGHVRYQDSSLLMTAAKAEGEVDADHTQASDVRYQLREVRGNGRADTIDIRGQRSRMSEVTYSTCNPEQRRWEIGARRIDIDRESGVGKARHAVIRLGNVPVMWLPYMSFPVDDRRRSGFLYPRLGTSGNTGVDLTVPYYLNLAPNYDATVSLRSLGRRGLMFGGEFRYLTDHHRGEISGSLLPNDDVTGKDRGSFTFKHFGTLSAGWNLRVNLNQVSDNRYFEDFGDSLSATSTSLLASSAGLYGRGRNWNASVALQSWDVTDPFVSNAQQPFRRLPRAQFGWRQPLTDRLDFGLRSEGVAFDHETLPGARRLDLYPYLRMPLESSWGFLRGELGYRYTAYYVDSGYLDQTGKRSPSRGTPIFSLDSGLRFERQSRLFGISGTQTLEPRVFYLRVPYRDQSELPVFDTRELTFSFDQLFRTNRFSGADRQGDANQLTVALSSSLFDDSNGIERLRASIGRIHYFDPPRVGLPGQTLPADSNSAYVADLSSELNDHWRVGITQQWDDGTGTQLSGVRGQYRFGDAGVANLAYRYRKGSLEQVDFSFLAPINARWRLVGRWNYSLFDRSTLEAFSGVEWQDCCMAIRVLGRHYIRNREGDTNNGLFLEIELKGLGSFGRGASELLERAILGYRR